MTTQSLMAVPHDMRSWGLRLERPLHNSVYGNYIVTEIRQADIELHHQVEVVDEDGQPLRGIWVVFAFPGGNGPDLSRLMPDVNHWVGGPAVLKGNARRTNGAGYAQHTFGSGGEDIFIWDVQTIKNPNEPHYTALQYPSTMVRNCSWQRPPMGAFEHTGVHITFQRQRTGVVTQRERLDELEERIKNLEALVGDITD